MKFLEKAQSLPMPSFVRLWTERWKAQLVPQATPAFLQVLSTLAPGIAARFAERVFMTPLRYTPPAGEAELLKTGHRFRVPFRGGELAAWSWGDGPTVLLVHGWAGRGGQMGSFVRPLVDAGYSVVAFDAPGHGQSPGRRSSMIDFCDAIQVMAHRVGPLQGVIAHSMGAPASALAMKRGVDVPCAVFIGAPVTPVTAAKSFGARMGLSESVLQKMRRLIEHRYLTRWEDLEMGTLARGQTARVLVVHDRDDRDVPIRCAETILEAWKGSEAFLTEGLGHRRVLREPKVISRVLAFLKVPS